MAARKSSITTSTEGNLDRTVSQIESKYGEGAIMRLGDEATKKIPCISTGALSVDLALGGGGLPRGRIVEIFGPEASGKTTITLHAIAEAQKAGGVAAFIDAEHALDPSWAKRLGVDLESLLVSQPSCGEEALQIAHMLVQSNAVDMLVIDSVAALVPKSEVDGQVGELKVGTQARLMSQALRILNPVIAKTKTCMVFINQVRQKISHMPSANNETTSGGVALKFYASVRLNVRFVQGLKTSDNETYGARVKVRVVKNKVAPPFKVTEVDLLHNVGMSREGDLMDLGIEDKLVDKSGSWFSYGETRLGQGREKAVQFLRDNPEICAELEQKIREARGLVEHSESEGEGEAPAELPAPADEEVAESNGKTKVKESAKKAKAASK